ncbi:hypothetical protein L798_03572 [Zootermopsis nevadensis]|uniref:Uncharacterized protein n=2 Tax=Zootermopsis nevadensis TaxID=136037 RepID=A0A067QQF7_ZOONE|nr:hypothetical protein L798_03572 [Zootermopsis nevadensis]
MTVAVVLLITGLIYFIKSFVSLWYYTEEEEEESLFLLPPDSREILASKVTTSAMYVFINGLLIYGAWKEKSILMLPCVFTHFVFVVLFAILLVMATIDLFKFDQVASGIMIMVIGGLILAFQTYCFAVVYTFYRQLEDSGCMASENLDYDKRVAIEETIINPEEGRKTYTQIEHDILQKQPQAV